jgi:CheY-like chemotaxis protein
MHILVVDDDALAGEMIGATLEMLDHTVILAENGIEAIDHINDHPELELIISDMNMPMMTGIELFHTLLEHEINLPFILLTGDDPEPLLAQEPRLSACLLKDYSLDERLPPLIDTIMKTHLGNKS